MSKKKNSRSHLDRREFIVLSSVAIAGVATSSFGAVASTNVAPLLAIGHWRGNRLDADMFSSSNDLKVVDAAALPSGDPEFLQSGASMRVEGFFRADSRNPISLALTVRFRVTRETDRTTPFLAWSHVDGSGVASSSAPASIFAPIESDDGLQLGLLRSSLASRRRRPVAGAPVDLNASADSLVKSPNDLESRFKLSLHSEAGVPKLALGTYFLAIRRDASQTAPDWSSVQVANSRAGQNVANGFLYRTDVMGDRLVDFDYIAITMRQGTRANPA